MIRSVVRPSVRVRLSVCLSVRGSMSCANRYCLSIFTDRVATVSEKKSRTLQGLLIAFSRPIPAIFYHVMLNILDFI